MRRASSLFVLSCLLVLSACKGKGGLGRPVVDRTRHGRVAEGCASLRPVRCDDVIPAPRELEVGVLDPAGAPACELAAGARITGTLQHCRLELDASTFAEFEIVDATLENVLIQLDGNVRLRIVESRAFEVTIEGGTAADPERPGLVQISHSSLGWTQIDAELLELVSSVLNMVALDVGRLSAVDIESRDAQLSARHATISAANLNSTQVGGGETLLVAGTRSINSRFLASEGVSRFYDSEITGGVVDGQLVSDVSSFADCRFGVDVPTAVHGWFTTIGNAVLCDRMEQVRFSAGSINCSRCEGPLRREDGDVCVDVLEPALEDNIDCASLDAAIECETFPEDTRPFDF